MRFSVIALMVLTTIYSCSNKDSFEIDTSDIQVDFELKRFDIDFYNTTKTTLPETKKLYPLFFPEDFTDSIAMSRIDSKDEKELYKETQKIFNNTSYLKEQLSSLFRHIKYYNSSFTAPDVITMITNIDYQNRVIYADSLLLISLDVYLGKNHSYYDAYPKYIRHSNTKENIAVDVAKEIINQQFISKPNRRFIDKIIAEGKKMYMLDLFLPKVSDTLKFGYPKEKMDWATENEEQIWTYFLENEMLFKTDSKLSNRFIDLAPFSKFYMSQDNLSPGRIGVWIGWQIVRSFMRENDVSLQQLLRMKEEEIFKKSKYKPRK